MLRIDQHKYCLQLALKDLFHNRVSTLLIIGVITAICLPLLIISSLREGYISIFKQSIVTSAQALRIDAVAKSTIAEQQYITDRVLHEFKSLPGVVEVVPQRSRTVNILDKENNQVDFEALTTIPTDPDLKRFGFEGNFVSADVNELAIIIRKKEVLKDLGFETVPPTLKVVVTRTEQGRVQSFFLDSKVVGTLEGGPSRKVYIPVPMANKLERWTLGFSVPEYGLPPAPSQEEALKAPEAESCLAISPLPLTEGKKQLLSNIGMQKKDMDSPFEELYLYTVIPKAKGEKITESVRGTIEDTLSGDLDVDVILNVKPIQLNLEGREISLHPSVTADARKEFLLLAGGYWLNTQRERFEIVLPLEAYVNSKGKGHQQEIPRTVETVIAQNPVQFRVVGTVKGQVGYMDSILLYRLHQLLNNEATYNLKHNAFDVNAKSPYEDRFLKVHVHVKEIEDILPVVTYFEAQKYEIYASSKVQVEALKQTNRMLRNLMLLVGITGGLAGIASLFVLMYEAIKRKRSEIGIMRAMGLSKGFITQIFLYQSVFYGLVGFAFSFLSFYILTLILDNPTGHAVLAIPAGRPESRIFQISLLLTCGFILGVIGISLIAGRSAAQSARNVDPADILSGN
ncbi:FtsX-like permease family protein [Candidatus Peregrinibacteria bacterium]|nr:FtsX-like permease family protein [Candidatus Peregrinibacteria bacterium]